MDETLDTGRPLPGGGDLDIWPRLAGRRTRSSSSRAWSPSTHTGDACAPGLRPGIVPRVMIAIVPRVVRAPSGVARPDVATRDDSPVEKVRHRARNVIDRFANRAGVAAVYHTPVGVKQLNQLFKSTMIDTYVTGERVTIEPGELRLGFDALRDEYTLLETAIEASPHVALVRSLLEPGGELAGDYVDRARNGTLDWRPAQRVSPALVAVIRRLFAARLEEIDRGEPTVVRVAWVENQPYLVDGSHRAASAFIRGQEVLCEDVSNVYGDSYFRWISAVVARRPSVYQTHLRFWGRVQRQMQCRTTARTVSR